MATPAGTRRRRGPRQLAALVGLAVGLAAAGTLAAPAYADPPPTLTVTASPDNLDLKVGGDARTVSINITTTSPAANVNAVVSVPLAEQGVTIKGSQGADCVAGANNTLNCPVGTLAPGAAKAIYVTVLPPQQSDLSPGDSKNGQGQVQVTADGAQPAAAAFGATLTNDAPQSVGAVSGQVTSEKDGQPVPGATVTISDSSGNSRQVTTNGNGEFSWSPSQEQTLAAGEITVTVKAGGFRQAKKTQQGELGQPLAFGEVKLPPVAKAKPTPTKAAPSPTESATPTKDSSGLSTIVWVLIVLGALLVIGGIVAIVLLLRKKDDGDDEDGTTPPYGGPPPSGYPGRGAADTAVISAIPGMGGDTPTVVHDGPLVRDDGRPYGDQTQVYGQPNAETQVYGQQSAETQVYGGETQAYGGGRPGADDATRTWQGGPAAPTSGGQPATNQPWGQPDTNRGAYEGTMYGRNSPTSGAAPTSGQPTSGAAPTSGPGYLTPGGTYGGSPYPSGAPGSGYGQYGGQQQPQGQQQGQRPALNEPTRTWQQPPPPQQQQPPARPAPPSGDETRLDKNDGLDWLD
ncbi:carboxypeptidase-like regulatory domain-containing protein [Actinocatenispora rupis]|nr:carboxypeptidase-like regulatory domain-containing protein [Actinocatenispora rupis]